MSIPTPTTPWTRATISCRSPHTILTRIQPSTTVNNESDAESDESSEDVEESSVEDKEDKEMEEEDKEDVEMEEEEEEEEN